MGTSLGKVQRVINVRVSAVDETWYEIRLECYGMYLMVKDRYSNL